MPTPTPAPAASAEDEETFLDKLFMLPPAGSFLYASAVAEFGLVGGSWPGTDAFGFGLHYAERGGVLANVLMAALVNTGNQQAAQERANQTGQTQYYQVHSPDDFGRMGLTIDSYGGFGGDMTGLLFDLFFIFTFNEDSPLPWCVDFGFTAFTFDGPDEMVEMKPDDHKAAGLGLMFGLIAPVTRWAQAEVRFRPVFDLDDDKETSSWWQLEGGATANLGNRFYLRGSFTLTADGAGLLFGAGGRL